MVTLLITGFGPFPGAPDNPSARLVARLARARRPALNAHVFATHIFPTSYAEIDRDMPMLIAKYRPAALVMFGLAARTPFLRVERQARNRVSPLFPDAQRVAPKANVIRRHAPATLRGRAPLARLVAAARTSRVDCILSNDAGRYVCNYTYWHGLEAAARRGGPRIVVFVHVPKLHARSHPGPRVKRPSLEQIVRTAQAMLISAASAARRS